MGDIVFIRDYERTKRAKEILGEVLPLVEFAKTGGPRDTSPSEYWPGGIDDLDLA